MPLTGGSTAVPSQITTFAAGFAVGGRARTALRRVSKHLRRMIAIRVYMTIAIRTRRLASAVNLKCEATNKQTWHRSTTRPMATPQQALYKFVVFALAKLDSATDSLTDDEPEEDYKELVTFTQGFSRHLKSAGHAAPPELRTSIGTALASVWDLRTDKPGPDLSVTTLRA
eukprot:6484848-Prymnesium_polylepis.1